MFITWINVPYQNLPLDLLVQIEDIGLHALTDYSVHLKDNAPVTYGIYLFGYTLY